AIVRWATARGSSLPGVLVTLRVTVALPTGASERPPSVCSRVVWLAAGAASVNPRPMTNAISRTFVTASLITMCGRRPRVPPAADRSDRDIANLPGALGGLGQ